MRPVWTLSREGLSPCSQSFTWEPSVVLPAPGGDVAHARVGSLRGASQAPAPPPWAVGGGVRDLAGVCEGGWAVCSSWGWRALAAVLQPRPLAVRLAPPCRGVRPGVLSRKWPQAVSGSPAPAEAVVGPRLHTRRAAICGGLSALAEPGAMGASVTSHCP